MSLRDSYLRLEKVVTSKQLRLAIETEEERRARLENDAAIEWLSLAMEMDKERKARLEKMVATTELMLALIKGVVNVGVVLSLKPILKSWQLCLSFKLDVHKHPHIDHELLSASSFFFICTYITYTL